MKKRGLAFMDALLKQKDRFDLNLELNEKIASRNSQAYRNHMLREQMKAIQEELDDAADDGESEADEEEDLRTRIENAHLPDEVKKAAMKEADRLDTMGQGNAEENIIRNYLDFLLFPAMGKNGTGGYRSEESRGDPQCPPLWAG